jgi:hypothetical protein
LLTLPQAFLFFLEKCLGAILRLMKIHAQVCSSFGKGWNERPLDLIRSNWG